MSDHTEQTEQKKYIDRFIKKAVSKKTYDEIHQEIDKLEEEDQVSQNSLRLLIILTLLTFPSLLIVIYFLFR